MADSPIRWRRPVRVDLQAARRNAERVGRRQAPDILKNGGAVVVVQPEQQEIPNCGFIQFGSHERMQSQAVQRIAAEEDSFELRVIERFDAEMIARAKQLSVAGVPE